jgi:hypothetical protein
MCEDFATDFGDKRTGCCIRTTQRLTPRFSAGIFLFFQLKIKLNGHHFDTIEVIKEEPQAVLNTLTGHDFQDAFKKWQKRKERCIHAEGDYFEGDFGQMVQSYFLKRWQHHSRELCTDLCNIHRIPPNSI